MGWLGTRSMSGGCVFRGEIDVLIQAMFMAQASESVVILSFRIPHPPTPQIDLLLHSHLNDLFTRCVPSASGHIPFPKDLPRRKKDTYWEVPNDLSRST